MVAFDESDLERVQALQEVKKILNSSGTVEKKEVTVKSGLKCCLRMVKQRHS